MDLHVFISSISQEPTIRPDHNFHPSISVCLKSQILNEKKKVNRINTLLRCNDHILLQNALQRTDGIFPCQILPKMI